VVTRVSLNIHHRARRTLPKPHHLFASQHELATVRRPYRRITAV